MKKNNSEIPVKDYAIVTEYIKKEKLSSKVLQELCDVKKIKEKIEIFKKDNFPNGVENASSELIKQLEEQNCKIIFEM